MISHVFLIIASLFAFGAILIVAAHRRAHTDGVSARKDWIKYAVYIVIVNGCIGLVFWSVTAIPVILAAILIAGGRELRRSLGGHVRKPNTLTILATILMALCLGHLFLGPGIIWQTGFVLAFLLTCVTDAFSQLWGKLLGSVKLCPTISPGKTVEGLVCGLATVSLGACLLADLAPHMSSKSLAVLGVAVGCAATTGDLAFSIIKRWLRIKDFSTVIPGHGGVLDRFDSFILAVPTFYWTQKLLDN